MALARGWFIKAAWSPCYKTGVQCHVSCVDCFRWSRSLVEGRGNGTQSSFKLQQFLCSRGYAMDNLDEAQRIHPS